ncbi:MAG: hypothetical protein ACREBG_05420 [Pyrinomonadaceae bacterium]
MPSGRVIPKKLPTCPGRDSRFTIRHNPDQANLWWVYYESTDGTLLPADEDHSDLVALVNSLKEAEGNAAGGGFSINEHFQVIARMTAPSNYGGQSIHVVGLAGGLIATYDQTIVFQNGLLLPTITPLEGQEWVGPLCGMTYSFAAPGSPKGPSRNFDQVFVEIDGQKHFLSVDAGINPYPPTTGPLATFLAALRRQLPIGGRFRVNEHGRAFTSENNIFIGIVPLAQWFKPLTPLS